MDERLTSEADPTFPRRSRRGDPEAAICHACAALHTTRCPNGPSELDHAEHLDDLDVEIDLDAMVGVYRREHQPPLLDAVTELVLCAQLCPDELRRTWEREHRQN
ncbi:hypothetical protein [Actinomycetospora chiangmaiensis]|uniref:hypothetical protein n=1 Tax=Actinomycetospora chiangmaiensis TaxID=402650 RepID=UPI000380BD84|nr:hypothetical protein [Actinomycetospora chiangmaiensis]